MIILRRRNIKGYADIRDTSVILTQVSVIRISFWTN